MKFILLVILLQSQIFKAWCSSDICSKSGAATCGDCISIHYTCAWCTDKVFNGTRCMPRDDLVYEGCFETEAPKDYQEQDVENKGVTDDPPIQVQPQRKTLKLRPHKKVKFPLHFRAAYNYPVDIYFLFDLSNTMKRNISAFANVAGEIASEIKKLTSNFAMAYGAFQDKVVMPFTNTQPDTLENACVGRANCGAPFDFRALHAMTNDSAKLIKRIEQSESETTGNLDHPEGGLEAMVQAITCKEQVKWREDSRKLLIFATDDRFHLAGDGRLAGIVLPNDLKCHLDKSGAYTHGPLIDYPSVGQLSYLTQKEDIHILFIVGKHKDKYEQLTKRIPSSKIATITENDDIKSIVVNTYRSIVSKVKMVYEPKVDGVNIKFVRNSKICKGQEDDVCEGISIGDNIEFKVSVEVTKCPTKKEERSRIIEIYPEKLKSDKLILELDMICECNCETDENGWEVDSPACFHGNGTLKCGICDCDPGRRGVTCECAADDDGSTQTLSCKSGDDEECNGHGVCDCGKCFCEDDFKGPLCECIISECSSYKGEVCGGPSRGVCGCSKCDCLDGYSGPACGCLVSNETCKYEDQICNGHGTCECGDCNCESKYGGKYCQKCVLCSDICSDVSLRECAVCSHSNREKQGGPSCTEKCKDIGAVDFVSELDVNATKCNHKLPDGCILKYLVEKHDKMLRMKINENKFCPEPLDITPIVAGIIGGVLLIALLILLLWKIITVLYDRREFSRFNEDIKKCKWSQEDNPIFDPATRKYDNPMMN